MTTGGGAGEALGRPLGAAVTRRLAAGLFGAGALAWAAGCSPQRSARPDPADHAGLLAFALAGPWRIEPGRDAARHPGETLDFWGLKPGMTVLELLPGRGWYTAILAPYLARSGGRLIAATLDAEPGDPDAALVARAFEATFLTDPSTFGAIERVSLGDGEAPLGPAGGVDLVICARNLHTLMAAGIAERVFARVRDALREGGILGVEQHRAPASGVQDPLARSGYVQEAYARALAQGAGLEFAGSSEVNANPRDGRDHPFGVWTLPPVLRTAPLGAPDNPAFDSAPYRAIGESDRMTLRFVRPPQAEPQEGPPGE